MENTPQRVCEENGGLWDQEKEENIPQCQAGCCLIGDQAAIVFAQYGSGSSNGSNGGGNGSA